MAADPLSFGVALKALNESIGAVWKNGSLLLWCLATVCAVVLAALFAAAHFNFGNATDLFKNYSVYIGIAFLTLIVFASFRTYAERPKRIFSFIPSYRQSFVHYTDSGDGRTFTQLALRFQVTNLSDSNMKLSAVRLLRPRLHRAAIVGELAADTTPGGIYVRLRESSSEAFADALRCKFYDRSSDRESWKASPRGY